MVLNEVFSLEIVRETKIGPNLSGTKSELWQESKGKTKRERKHSTYPTSTGSSKERTKRPKDQTESKTDRQKGLHGSLGLTTRCEC